VAPSLIVIFGCGGDRDRGKRPLMGAIAVKRADRVVLTSDNPRGEDAQMILEEIRVAAPAAEVLVDRGQAIRRTILAAHPADVVLIAGKGHESYQEMGGVRRPFSDAAQARAALTARQEMEAMTVMMDLLAVARATAASCAATNVEFCGVSTDSRSIAAGELFLALRGENFDGHNYLAAAKARGAVAAVVAADAVAEALQSLIAAIWSRSPKHACRSALWPRIGASRFTLPLIAVTGSNGKTTTKEMIASILKVVYGDAVLVTQGNYNNDIGLPLTLLRLQRRRHRAAVIEMGMNHPGEIAYLAGIAHPSVAVVTNAQRAHLEGMGSLEAIATEKGSYLFGAWTRAVSPSSAPTTNGPSSGAARVVASGR
jgi:murE/murF fusion protein